ncbi:MAG: cystathionine beta-synthase [Mycobacteriales bacterium]
MEVYESLVDLVGGTPLVRLRAVTAGISAPVYAKVESFNPGGSVKDRIALAMIEAAEESGELKAGGTIVEPTSGNTGVGLAIAASQRGYKCIFVMPDKMSTEKVSLLRAYGAEVVVCPTAVAPEHPDSYYSVARRLAAETAGGWSPDQYSNPNNPLAHYRSTGPEVWDQTDGRVTHFVAGIGTGGTIGGVARYLKERNPGVVVVGADPEGSVYSGGTGRPYLVEGVGEDFWPATYDASMVDRVEAVSDRDSFLTARRVTREEGILIGGSGGLAVAAALRVARELDESAFVVVLLPDSGRGYLSKIFNDEWMADYGFLVDATQPTVLDVLRRKGADLPELVHVHPDETVGSAIGILREYGVSQMPVVKAEPPVMAAEVVGSVIERDLLDAVFADRAALDEPVERHMSKALPTVGSGEPVGIVIAALEAASAALVLDDGKPVGVLTRADLLGYLASQK